ncbi:hypothetical protein OG203_44235 [Nocardia sp. NBC_01499]|uniref:hypothetical protein n=1 Tax=Nocardia sp. NBC_01499 TaxID=2903597 RepID=UPI0038679589
MNARNESTTQYAGYFALRACLLGPSRTKTLTGQELIDVGRLVYGDPSGMSLYGVPAPQMATHGLRILGRTAIECSVDAYAIAVANWLAASEFAPPADAFVADLFCGSGNIGYHLGDRLDIPVHAAELDPLVFDHTRHNFSVMDIGVNLQLLDYRDLLSKLGASSPTDIYVVEPPWGPAFTADGLNLATTAPPVPEILADIAASRRGVPCLIVIKTNDQIAYDSLGSCFAEARHLTSVTPAPVLPTGANMDFHVYQLE